MYHCTTVHIFFKQIMYVVLVLTKFRCQEGTIIVESLSHYFIIIMEFTHCFSDGWVKVVVVGSVVGWVDNLKTACN